MMRYVDGRGGFYELNPFPGCNQIVVSNHSWVAPEHRGKGLGTVIHKERLDVMKVLGYDYAICTVKLGNVAQINILNKNGWKCLDEFLNRETGNTVLVFGRRLQENEEITE
jgi:GNAT superfamily N-acetyltransferase